MSWSSAARGWRGRIFVGLAVCCVPGSAEAHAAFKNMGSFWSGVLHPLTSFDQVGFLLGLAIWASFQDPRLDAPVVGTVFVGSLFGSLVAWRTGWEFDTLLYVSALMVLIGLAGAARLTVGKAPLISVAACGSSLVGIASTGGMGGLTPGLFALGAAVASASVTSYGLIAAARSGPAWVKIAFRASASWITAIGLMVFALEYSRLSGHR
jgi:hydrogenase/urease accessory protein HupE